MEPPAFSDHQYSIRSNHIFRQWFYGITIKRRNVHCLSNISSNLITRTRESSPDETEFFLTRVEFLGHVIEINTITSKKILAYM